MAKNWTLVVRSANDDEPASTDKFKTLRHVVNQLTRLAGGTRTGTPSVDFAIDAVAATGTVALAGGSGTVGATVNGVANTVTWGTSDSASAAAIAAVVNASANALVNQHVTAGSNKGTVTISSGSGTITATINGVACAVTWATSDSNTGDLLVAKIILTSNSNSTLAGNVTASNNAGVVTITDSSGAALTLTATGTGATAATMVVLTSKHPGASGNAITLAASGTGATASGARLTAGSRTQTTFSF